MLSQEELNAIKKRAEKATPGPWIPSCLSSGYVVCDDREFEVIASVMEYNDDGTVYMVFTDNHENNRQFIAHAREDIPKLLVEIERLRKLAEVLDYFLQEIDTHIRSTRSPMPYIKETMRKYFEFIMGGDDE